VSEEKRRKSTKELLFSNKKILSVIDDHCSSVDKRVVMQGAEPETSLHIIDVNALVIQYELDISILSVIKDKDNDELALEQFEKILNIESISDKLFLIKAYFPSIYSLSLFYPINGNSLIDDLTNLFANIHSEEDFIADLTKKLAISLGWTVSYEEEKEAYFQDISRFHNRMIARINMPVVPGTVSDRQREYKQVVSSKFIVNILEAERNMSISLRSGCGKYFAYFEFIRNALKSFDELLNKEHLFFSVKARAIINKRRKLARKKIKKQERSVEMPKRNAAAIDKVAKELYVEYRPVGFDVFLSTIRNLKKDAQDLLDLAKRDYDQNRTDPEYDHISYNMLLDSVDEWIAAASRSKFVFGQILDQEFFESLRESYSWATDTYYDQLDAMFGIGPQEQCKHTQLVVKPSIIIAMERKKEALRVKQCLESLQLTEQQLRDRINRKSLLLTNDFQRDKDDIEAAIRIAIEEMRRPEILGFILNRYRECLKKLMGLSKKTNKLIKREEIKRDRLLKLENYEVEQRKYLQVLKRQEAEKRKLFREKQALVKRAREEKKVQRKERYQKIRMQQILEQERINARAREISKKLAIFCLTLKEQIEQLNEQIESNPLSPDDFMAEVDELRYLINDDLRAAQAFQHNNRHILELEIAHNLDAHIDILTELKKPIPRSEDLSLRKSAQDKFFNSFDTRNFGITLEERLSTPVNQRDYLLERCGTSALKEIIDMSYRLNAVYGDGGTACMLWHEAKTGEFVASNYFKTPARSHFLKAIAVHWDLMELRESLLDYRPADFKATDLILIDMLLDDLETAISAFEISPYNPY
jgi:hypothetical protein